MEFKAKVEVDVQEAFYALGIAQQRAFLKENINILYVEDISEALEDSGYKIVKDN